MKSVPQGSPVAGEIAPRDAPRDDAFAAGERRREVHTLELGMLDGDEDYE